MSQCTRREKGADFQYVKHMKVMSLSAEKFRNPLHSALLSYTGPTFETFVSIINAEINAFPLLQHIKLLKFSTFFFSSAVGHVLAKGKTVVRLNGIVAICFAYTSEQCGPVGLIPSCVTFCCHSPSHHLRAASSCTLAPSVCCMLLVFLHSSPHIRPPDTMYLQPFGLALTIMAERCRLAP